MPPNSRATYLSAIESLLLCRILDAFFTFFPSWFFVYRSEVKEMIAIGKRKREKEAKKKVQYNTGLDYMPFQR